MPKVMELTHDLWHAHAHDRTDIVEAMKRITKRGLSVVALTTWLGLMVAFAAPEPEERPTCACPGGSQAAEASEVEARGRVKQKIVGLKARDVVSAGVKGLL